VNLIASNDAPSISARHLCVSFDEISVLSDINLDFFPGKTSAILGANGSGKTTLIRALLGLLPIHEGTVEIHGQNLEDFKDWHRVAYVPQKLINSATVPVSVFETVNAALVYPSQKMSTKEKKSHVLLALAQVGLEHRAKDRLDELSDGQQRRVLLARALATKADIYVLDEPTAGVDSANQVVLVSAIRSLVAKGSCVIMITHELGPFKHDVDNAIVLANGGVAYHGPVSNLPSEAESIHHNLGTTNHSTTSQARLLD
jgi:zinc transport system ATP-binding protein